MRRPLLIVLAVGLVVVLAIGITQAGSDAPQEGDIPRALSREEVLEPLAGAPAPLAALHRRANALPEATPADYRRQLRALRGYPVVVNAWASWCGPCKLEFPLFQRAAAQLGKRVAFLGLNVSDNREEAAAYLAEAPVPYPSLVDGDFKILGEAAPGVRGLPATIFYDAQGRRTVHQGGYTKQEDLLADIRRYAGA
jgi:cytochrome c biogenesis protein CcmG, thiol:disulfide interchange protein DsbE